MPSFVSCNSESCLCKKQCGRHAYYTDKEFEGDFFGKNLCKGEKGDVMFLSIREAKENNMAKKKEK